MIITFLVPVYNEVKTVENAITEVLELKNINKKIIIIDNCSTDGSIEIVKKFQNFENLRQLIHNIVFLTYYYFSFHRLPIIHE